jgi:repressor LexA
VPSFTLDETLYIVILLYIKTGTFWGLPMKLTARQQQVLDIIRRSIDETGYPPTRAEIAAELGFRSANAAEEHLRALARKGAIEMVPGASRGIRLPEAEEDLGLPVIGQVAAGSPILAQEHIEDHCTVRPEFFSPSADYLLRVRGTSMKNIGILDGDLLAVHRTQDVQNGQVVVARVGEDEVTVKRFRKEGTKVLLIAENEEFDPIEIDLTEQELFIEGLGVGVIRRSDFH